MLQNLDDQEVPITKNNIYPKISSEKEKIQKHHFFLFKRIIMEKDDRFNEKLPKKTFKNKHLIGYHEKQRYF